MATNDSKEVLIINDKIEKDSKNGNVDKSHKTEKKDEKSLAVAICAAMFSISALIRASCWPQLKM